MTLAAPEDRRTPLYDLHRKLGARMVSFAGWQMPIQYDGIVQEHNAVRTQLGLFDVSHMGELEVRGPDAVAQVDRLITNALARAENGRALYTGCCNAAGTLLDDLIVYRLADDHVLVVCNASNRDKIASHFSAQIRPPCALRDISDETSLLAVQGPEALERLQGAFGAAFGGESLRPFRVVETTLDLGRAVPVRVARTGYTGEDGAEIFCPNAAAAELFERLLELGAKPCGLAARDTLRLEAALCLYGNDIDETTTPLEAGLAWTVKLDKPEFIGKEALERQHAEGPLRRLVGFEMTGRGIARSGYALLDPLDPTAPPLGRCTSGSPSPTLGKNIGLGYLPVSRSALGSELSVDCRGKSISARVVETPFYRRPKPTKMAGR